MANKSKGNRKRIEGYYARAAKAQGQPIEFYHRWERHQRNRVKGINGTPVRSDATLVNNAKSAAFFSEWLAEKGRTYADMDRDLAGEYREWMERKYKKPKQSSQGARLLMKFWLGQSDPELLETTEQPRLCRFMVPVEKETEEEYVPLTMAQVDEIVKAAETSNTQGLGDMKACLIALLYASGFRRDELASCRVRDLKLNAVTGKWELKCNRSKFKTRTVNILVYTELAQRWHDIRKGADPNDPLFVTWNGSEVSPDNVLRSVVYGPQVIRYRCKECGNEYKTNRGNCACGARLYSYHRMTEDVSKRYVSDEIRGVFEGAGQNAHLLRKSRLTHLSFEWMEDPNILMEFAGHTDMRTTMKYIKRARGKLGDDQETIRKRMLTRADGVEGWTCRSCLRLNSSAFKFCPVCGGDKDGATVGSDVQLETLVDSKLEERLNKIVEAKFLEMSEGKVPGIVPDEASGEAATLAEKMGLDPETGKLKTRSK